MQTAKPSYCAKNAKNVNVQKFTEHPVRCGMAQKKHINSMDLSTEQANYSNLQRTTVRLFYGGTDWCFSCPKCFDSGWLRRNHPAGQGILPNLSVSIARRYRCFLWWQGRVLRTYLGLNRNKQDDLEIQRNFLTSRKYKLE